MHGIGELTFSQWGTFFVASFMIELILNRYPWAVAIAVPVIGFVVLVLGDLHAFDFNLAAVFGTIAVIGILPSLIGAGLARYIRFWIELKRVDRKDRDLI